MKFIQYKDGSCEIIFDENEKEVIFKKGKIFLTAEGLRHFGNELMRAVAMWNLSFNEKVKNLTTDSTSKIK
jgi:hypothetical protein